MNARSGLAAMWVLLCAATATATGAPEELADVLEPIRQEHRVPALAAAVLVGDSVTAIGATGSRRRGGSDAATSDDLWHLASCTKAMTATAVARLVERGLLRWETPLIDVVGDMKIHPEYAGVTIEQLLSHRAGTPSPEQDLKRRIWGWLWSHQGSVAMERAAYVHDTLRASPLLPPGSAYQYSNAGYVIAGHVIERVTGKPWERVMAEEVFNPLGMKRVGFGAPVDGGAAPWGHGERGKAVAPGPAADNPPALGPAATVHASLESWARFVAIHLNEPPAEGAYLKRETLDHLHRPIDGQEYALGWIATRQDWGGGTVLMHAGSNTMWYAAVWIAPARGFALLAVANQGGTRGRAATDAAVIELISGRHGLGSP